MNVSYIIYKLVVYDPTKKLEIIFRKLKLNCLKSESN